MTANLNVASSKMSAMLCCSGEKDSVGRDLKSAQNTPSRQPLQPPYTMGSGQFMAPGQPQPLRQQNQQQTQQPMFGGPGGPGGPNNRMMNPMAPGAANNFGGPGGGPPGGPGSNMGGPMGQQKDDYRKVIIRSVCIELLIFNRCQPEVLQYWMVFSHYGFFVLPSSLFVRWRCIEENFYKNTILGLKSPTKQICNFKLH